MVILFLTFMEWQLNPKQSKKCAVKVTLLTALGISTVLRPKEEKVKKEGGDSGFLRFFIFLEVSL